MGKLSSWMLRLGPGTLRLGSQNPVLFAVVMMAGYVFVTTVMVVVEAYSPLPFWDAWDHWRTQTAQPDSTVAFLFSQHNEHRLVVPRLFFWMDEHLASGSNVVLLTSTLAILALHVGFLGKLLRRAFSFNRGEHALVVTATVCLLFSAQQFHNLVWGFQIQFALVFCMTAGAVLSLIRAEEEWRRNGPAALWIALTGFFALTSTGSMANGLLTWPLVALFSFWLVLPGKYRFALVLGTIASTAAYLYDYHRPGHHANPLDSLTNLPRVGFFSTVYLGAPFDPIGRMVAAVTPGSETAVRNGWVSLVGAVAALATVCAFFLLWQRRRLFNAAQAGLVYLLAFVVATAALVGLGRAHLPIAEAMNSRYATAALSFWSVALMLSWSLMGRIFSNRPVWAGFAKLATAIGVFSIAVLPQREKLADARAWGAGMRQSEAAVVAGVLDEESWRRLYHTPAILTDSLRYMRLNRLSVFRPDWVRWIGTPLGARFTLGDEKTCLGFLDGVQDVWSASPGRRFSGWAWDNLAKNGPKLVLLADGGLNIVGVTRTVTDRPDVPLAVPQVETLRVGWVGYVPGLQQTEVTAYLVHDDLRSICPLRSILAQIPASVHLPEVSREGGTSVPFDQIGEILSDEDPKIEGAWTRDGYHPDAKHPSLGGRAYGSWSGSDSNTGRIRLGPFPVGGASTIAVPLVTGPQNQGLSVRVVDAKSGATIAALSPPPIRLQWWAWRVDVPKGAAALEIVVEDRGTAWGEWQAIAGPRAVRSRNPS